MFGADFIEESVFSIHGKDLAEAQSYMKEANPLQKGLVFSA